MYISTTVRQNQYWTFPSLVVHEPIEHLSIDTHFGPTRVHSETFSTVNNLIVHVSICTSIIHFKMWLYMCPFDTCDKIKILVTHVPVQHVLYITNLVVHVSHLTPVTPYEIGLYRAPFLHVWLCENVLQVYTFTCVALYKFCWETCWFWHLSYSTLLYSTNLVGYISTWTFSTLWSFACDSCRAATVHYWKFELYSALVPICVRFVKV